MSGLLLLAALVACSDNPTAKIQSELRHPEPDFSKIARYIKDGAVPDTLLYKQEPLLSVLLEQGQSEAVALALRNGSDPMVINSKQVSSIGSPCALSFPERKCCPDKRLADLNNLADPDVLAGEIIENIEAGLESFREISGILEPGAE